MFFSARQEICHRSGIDILADDKWPAAFVSNIVNGDDVRMAAQTSHRLRLTNKPGHAIGTEIFGLEKRDHHIAIKTLVSGKIDFFLASLSERSPDDIAPGCKRRGHTPGIGFSARCNGQRISVDRVAITHKLFVGGFFTLPGPQSARPGLASVCSPSFKT